MIKPPSRGILASREVARLKIVTEGECGTFNLHLLR